MTSSRPFVYHARARACTCARARTRARALYLISFKGPTATNTATYHIVILGAGWEREPYICSECCQKLLQLLHPSAFRRHCNEKGCNSWCNSWCNSFGEAVTVTPNSSAEGSRRRPCPGGSQQVPSRCPVRMLIRVALPRAVSRCGHRACPVKSQVHADFAQVAPRFSLCETAAVTL